MARIRLSLAQIDLVVGDLDGNVERVVAAIGRAESSGVDLLLAPELAVTGYPPEDLLLKPAFVEDNLAAIARVAAATGEVVAVVGYVGRQGDRLANAAAVCHRGEVVGTYAKRNLPNYAVFDEQRYFAPGTGALELFEVAGVPVGLSICEDAWSADGPIRALGAGGAQLVANLNASPFHQGKRDERYATLAARAAEAAVPIAYANLVGGQDELVFDGASMVTDAAGAVIAQAPQFVEHDLVVDLDLDVAGPCGPSLPLVQLTSSTRSSGEPVAPALAPSLEPTEELYRALVLGTRDYVTKNGFDEVVIGLSGGIDSTLVAVVAADALGPERVHGVLMPSRYSSDHSVADAESLADALGIGHRAIPIEPAHRALVEMLEPHLGGALPGLTEENLQSRIRGVLLMALSNAEGWLVLTTSNKSESAVGYSTLYGDSAGGFAVIKDVPKLAVYELCRWRNRRAADAGEPPPVPTSVLDKPPSAELRPDQRDDQSLPSYDELDPLLASYVEGDRTAAELIAQGADPELVRRITRLVDLAEYKRRQFPPGPRVTSKAFGKDRRLPITNGYRS